MIQSLLKKTALFWVILHMTAFAIAQEYLAESRGDATGDAKKAYLFEEIVVTGTGTETEFLVAPASISIIDQKSLERNSYSQISDIVQDIPNVEIIDVSIPGMKRVRIRGEAASRSLILVDGQRISEQKSMEGAPLLVNANDVERIEVVKGPSSVLYGSDAIGGVINLITKKGGEEPVEGSIGTSYDSSNGGLDHYGSVQGLVDHLEYRLSYAVDEDGDRQTPEGTLENSSSRSEAYSLLLGYKSEDIRTGLKFEYYNADINSHTAKELTAEGSDFDYFQLDLPEWSRRKLAFYYNRSNITTWLSKLKAEVFYQNTFKDFKNDMDIVVGLKLRIRTRNYLDTYGGRLQAEILASDSHILVTGLEVSYDRLLAEGETRTTWGTYEFPSSDKRKTSEFEAHLATYAAYLQDEWSFADQLTLITGLRGTFNSGGLDRADIKEKNLLNGFSANIDQDTEQSEDFHTTGGITLLYQGRDKSSIRLSWVNGYKYPNLQQLYIGTSHGSDSAVYSNPDLKPETSQTSEAGYRNYGPKGSFDLTLFHTFARNYIGIEENPDVPNTDIYTNINTSTSHGAEFTGDMNIGLISPYLVASYIKRKYQTDSYETYDTGVPSWSGKSGIRWESENQSRPVTWIDLYVRAADDAFEYDHDENTTKEYEGWATYNLGFGWKGSLWSNPASYSLEALNLSNLTYRRAQNSLYEAEMHFVAKLTMEF